MVRTTKKKNLKKNQMMIGIHQMMRKTRLRIYLANNKRKILILKMQRNKVMKNRKLILPKNLTLLKRKAMSLRSNLNLCSGHGIKDIWF